MDKMLDLADNWLNLRRVAFEVSSDNPAAIHLYQESGFAIEGIKRCLLFGDGGWVDSAFMARLRPA